MEGIWVVESNTTISTKEFDTMSQVLFWFGFHLDNYYETEAKLQALINIFGALTSYG